MRILSLAVMFFAVTAFAQEEGELKSILVPPSNKPVDGKDHPDAPEPASKADEVSLLKDMPKRDRTPNPIPGLEPIPAPKPIATPNQKTRTPASPVSAKPATKPTPSKSKPTITLRGLGLTMVPNSTRVRGVVVGSQAEKAGLRPGDEIEAINRSAVRTGDALNRAVASQASDFDVIVLRGERRHVARIATAPKRRAGRIPAQRASASSENQLTSQPLRQAATPTPARPTPAATSAPAPRPSSEQTNNRPFPRRRPLIGDGGRIIGNGRVINSFRRVLGLN